MEAMREIEEANRVQLERAYRQQEQQFQFLLEHDARARAEVSVAK